MFKTKIIAILGPASRSLTVLRRMIRLGLDVVRLNFSHATHGECLEAIRMVRQLNKAAGKYPVEAVDMMNKIIGATEERRRCRGC